MYKQGLPLFDGVAREADPIAEHKKNLTRVEDKINDLVIEYCGKMMGSGGYLHLQELEEWVKNRHKSCVAGSPGRILRLLKRKEIINYVLISRRKSIYKILEVWPEEL